MSLTISMPQETVLETDFGYPNTGERLARGTTRVAAASETCHSKPKEVSKVKGTAARIFKPTRPEYKESFGAQLGNIHGRRRWDITGRAAALWHGSSRTGLRDTIQESLARPEQNIYKGFSIRQEAILHCYMIGHDQECAHPTIAICHPLGVVLRRSVKLISGMIKKYSFKTLTVETEMELLAKSVQHNCTVVVSENARNSPDNCTTNMCGADLLLDDFDKHATLGGVVLIEGKIYGLTVSHPFVQKVELPAIEPSNAVKFYDSNGDEESDSDVSQGKCSSEETTPAIDAMESNEDANGASLRRDGPAFSESIRDGLRRYPGGTAMKLLEAHVRAVIHFPDEATEGNSLDWALVDLSRYEYACTNEIRPPQTSKALSITGVSEIQPCGKVLIATRRGILEAKYAGTQPNALRKFGIDYRATSSVQLINGYFEIGDSGSWAVNANTGELYGTVVAGIAAIGTGYIIPSKAIFSDIRRKAWPEMIDFLPQKISIDIHLPSLTSPIVQAASAEDRIPLEVRVDTGADKLSKPISVGETGFIARYMEEAARIYTSFALLKADSAGMEAVKVGEGLKVRKRTKTGCLTCRKRRIKCGEQKPVCINCIRGKRKCEGYTPRVLFKVPQVSARGFDAKGNQAHIESINRSTSPTGTGFPSSSRVEHVDQLPLVVPRPESLSIPSRSSTEIPPEQYHRPSPYHQLTPKQPSSDANQDFLHQSPQEDIASLSLADITRTGGTEFRFYEKAVDSRPSNELGRCDTLSKEKESGRHATSRSTTNEANLDSPSNTILSKPTIFPAYRPTHIASLTNDFLAPQIFYHFLLTIGPSLSIFERHCPNPEPRIVGTAIPIPQQALWTYVLPTVALTNQALLHAMLALASLHMAKLNSTSIQHSLKYYHLALRRLARRSQLITERTDLGTIAAALLLAHFEATTAEYGKWISHLLGAKYLLLILDIKQKSKGEKTQAGSAANLNWYQSNLNGPDGFIISQLMGKSAKYDESGHSIDNKIEPVRASIDEDDVQRRESYSDLFWWYCKQDVQQSMTSGKQLLLPYDHWGQCPPRGPIGELDAIYGTMDHLILLMSRIIDFASRDRLRRSRAVKVTTPDSPEELDLRNAEDEWQKIQIALDFFEHCLGPEWQPLPHDFVPPRASPFGPCLQYRLYSIACIWATYYAARIVASRVQPSTPPTAILGTYNPGTETNIWASLVGRVCCGLEIPLRGQSIQPSLSAALKDISFGLFIAGVQYRDEDQRRYTVDTLRAISEATGFELSASFAATCEANWDMMADAEKDPAFNPDIKLEHVTKREAMVETQQWIKTESKEYVFKDDMLSVNAATEHYKLDKAEHTKAFQADEGHHPGIQTSGATKPSFEAKFHSPTSLDAEAAHAEDDVERLRICEEE